MTFDCITTSGCLFSYILFYRRLSRSLMLMFVICAWLSLLSSSFFFFLRLLCIYLSVTPFTLIKFVSFVSFYFFVNYSFYFDFFFSSLSYIYLASINCSPLKSVLSYFFSSLFCVTSSAVLAWSCCLEMLS